MKKRFLSVFLALTLCLTLLPTAALAVGETTYLWQASDSKIYTSNSTPSDLDSTTEGTELATTTKTEGSTTVTYYHINSAGTYQLAEDVTLDNPILVEGAGTVTLDLNGYVLQKTGSGSVIRVGNSFASPTTGSLTLTDSRATDSTAEHKFTEDSTTHLWELDAYGTKTVTGGIITGGTGTNISSSKRGGGVFVDKGSTFTMKGGHIVGCTAANGGGGVFVYGSSGSNTTFTMSGGSIQGCTASGNGGGVFLDAPISSSGTQFTMNGGTISNCIANNGGGVSVNSNTTFNMSGGTIENCTAKGDGSSANSNGGMGGGVQVGGTFTMKGGTISNCIANGGSGCGCVAMGGGVYVNSNTCTLQGGTISSCTATGGGAGGPQGGGMYVLEGKNLTVGGGSTVLTITGNTSGTDSTTTTDDNIYLSTDGSSAATITGIENLHSGSSISLTPSTASDLDLTASAFDADVSGDGYAWDKDSNTLTLQNKILGNITLPNEDTKIIIQGNVIVNSIGDVADGKTLTIEGSGTHSLTVVDTVNANLGALKLQSLKATVDTLKLMGGTGKLTLDDADITARYISWYHTDSTTNGLIMNGSSKLKITGTDSGIYVGKITLDTNSAITLDGGYLSTTNSTSLRSILTNCQGLTGYSIGPDPDGGSNSYLLNPSNAKATDITLRVGGGDSAPTPSTPPSYSDGGPTYYRVTVSEPVNGAVEASAKRATSGTTVTITVSPASGYELETLTVLDRRDREVALTDKGDGKYTFKMPASNVTVEATFMEDNSMLNFFVDVTADKYYYDAVLWAAKNGITGGIDENHFGPDRSCTRAQAVTFLWRAAGSPEPKAVSSFTDVSADAYYAKAVAWAVENGITGGIGGNKFAPDATCTRAQAVTFLYRAAGSPAVSSDAAFSDVGTDAYYANAVAWAAKEGITGGIGGGLFGSDNDCTRAQIVTFLYRSVK